MTKHLTKILAAGAAAALASAASAAGAAAPRKTHELLEKGKASYATNCAACHGDAGKGDGVAAAALSPKPRDLVSGKYQRGTAPKQVFDTVTRGIPGTAMAGFGHLPDDERWALTYYVLDLHQGAHGKHR